MIKKEFFSFQTFRTLILIEFSYDLLYYRIMLLKGTHIIIYTAVLRRLRVPLYVELRAHALISGFFYFGLIECISVKKEILTKFSQIFPKRAEICQK